MQEAFTALQRAKREAEDRLRQAESEGDKSKHKLSAIRHAIRDLEEGLQVLRQALKAKLIFIRLWNLVEEGNRNSVQIFSSTGKRPASRRSRSNRRRT